MEVKVGRPANGETVKVNTEISRDSDDAIRNYQIVKAKRLNRKVSKVEAIQDFVEFAIPIAQQKVETWETELEEIEQKINELKNS